MISGGDGLNYDIEFYLLLLDRVFFGLCFIGIILMFFLDMVLICFLVLGFVGFVMCFLLFFVFDCFDIFFFGVKFLKDVENLLCGEYFNVY